MSQSKRPVIHPTLRDVLCKPSQTALETFGPWNSASTGHQRGDGPYSSSIGWRQARNLKLGTQFGARTSGGVVPEDGEWEWVPEERLEEISRTENGDGDIRSFMQGVRKGGSQGHTKAEKVLTTSFREEDSTGAFYLDKEPYTMKEQANATANRTSEANESSGEPSNTGYLQHAATSTNPSTATSKQKHIFANLTFYINGSTLPAISDHKLKHLLSTHGANLSLSLARRSVTHVILGRPNIGSKPSAASAGAGAGGGLAAGKLQREIERRGGKGVKFVDVEWILESIKANTRLPESRFANLHMASSKQRSVRDMFCTKQ
ncbi:hypothetical protein AJ80_05665 [Polytolypa hystricis UAMH7299]|uniref:BRCT domain-containing protein n=1 Tax=Polytolypa hystricis (strain UAMH7299) TaxID=1447883 RepID=A0A2B7Y282_POLH7|nr:hypothetical protein AJ80_05665 [Polytolypa hystricis UAMH7299]